MLMCVCVFIHAVHTLLQGGPLHHVLHDVLGAYVCYRPDVGYVSTLQCICIHLKSVIIALCH